jgi:hypothetical protein
MRGHIMVLVLLAYACDPTEPKAHPGAARTDTVVAPRRLR